MRDAAEPVQRIRLLYAVFLFTVPLIGVCGELVGTEERGDITWIRLPLIVLAVAEIVVTRSLRGNMIDPAVETLRRDPADRVALERWAAGHVVSFSMAETIALFGLVLRFLGGMLLDAAPFYAASFLLLLMFRPRNPTG